MNAENRLLVIICMPAYNVDKFVGFRSGEEISTYVMMVDGKLSAIEADQVA
jgi:hypothetical protein